MSLFMSFLLILLPMVCIFKARDHSRLIPPCSQVCCGLTQSEATSHLLLLVSLLIEGSSDKMGKLDFYVIWSLNDAPRQFVWYVI